ncbi:chemotaxis protein CheW [Pseudomonas sp. JL972]|uniref:CheW domain-containing protein n=1 Tax=Stutzerimonas stutzeri group TaxID=136846 RepID=UPI0012D86916|nr:MULTISPECIES: CheW domain-containing protein [Stutzerimonas stutzeri group]MBV2207775.1 chemotaxis protein CheW [Pseudomonas sp.]MTZ12500.1 chemotaxis protein CheW [Stutzerimonas degradans]
MSRAVLTETRSQLALQSYLDALLQDATVELAESVSLDEFQAAVLEEQQRDSLRPVEIVTELPVESLPTTTVVAEIAVPAGVVEPVVELSVAAAAAAEPPALDPHQPPQWGEQPFECLLFDVAGLTLAVPLVCLGSIYPLTGQELTPLFGQPDWFLGILPSHAGNLKVLDTARWVMPDRYRDDFREGLQYVISVQGYEWGLAVHQVSRSIRLDPREVKWRTQRNQRPWLAGTVIEHMCALVDVTALAELIASGAVRQLHPASTKKH